MILMHNIARTTHENSANYIENEYLIQIKLLRIDMLEKIKNDTEEDLVHHYTKGKASAIHFEVGNDYNCLKCSLNRSSWS